MYSTRLATRGSGWVVTESCPAYAVKRKERVVGVVVVGVADDAAVVVVVVIFVAGGGVRSS